MNYLFYRLKDKLYYYMVDKNWGVGPEYHRYVETHKEEHINNRCKSWWVLLRLNWHYRVLRRTTPLIYNKNLKNKQKMPCVSGPESEIYKRLPAHQFAKQLLKYDVISFDIFDTLVLRPFAKPSDLFYVVEKRLNYINAFSSFANVRRTAEKEARDRNQFNYGNREVTIDDIYSIVEQKTGIPKEKGICTELETEIDYCFANPYMKIVFDIVKRQNKKIIITSDMYLPENKLKIILNKCGYDGYTKLYVSCDYKASKANGELYDYIKNDFVNNTIVHIGDNYEADVKEANNKNLTTKFYKNVNFIGNNYRAEWMSNIIGSAYAGVINTTLHNGSKVYSFFYEYGFIYGGLYILGFCNWLHNQAKLYNVDKIIFLARDGFVYSKVFNYLFDDIDNEYMLWSRHLALKNTLEMNLEGFIERVIKQKVRAKKSLELNNILKEYCPFIKKEFLKEFGLQGNTLINQNSEARIIKFFTKYWQEIVNYNESIIGDAVKEEVKGYIGNASKVAIVDVGWTGTGPLSLKYLIENKWNLNTKTYCWMAGNINYSNSNTENLYLDGSVQTYLFSNFHNRRHQQLHLTTNKKITSNAVFELFTQAFHPSIKNITINGNYDFDMPEVENYKIYTEIQKGIFDFCKTYSKFFENDKWLYNISGFDAYRPFTMAIRNEKFFLNNFGDIVYQYGIGSNNLTKNIEKISERIK